MDAGPADLEVEDTPGGIRLTGAVARTRVVQSTVRPEGAGTVSGVDGDVVISADAGARVLADAVVACLYAADAPGLLVHGASLRLAPEAGLLLTGVSGAGKTTLALALAERGHGLYGDDVAWLRPDGPGAWDLHPMRRAAQLRPPAAAPFWDPDHRSARTAAPLPGRAPAPARLRHVVVLTGHAASPNLRRFTPSLHEIPRLHPFTRCNTDDAAWGDEEARWLLRFARLVQVLRTATCWELESGSVPDTVEALERLAAT